MLVLAHRLLLLLLLSLLHLPLLPLVLSCLPLAAANTEKAIFVAPPKITLPNVRPGLENLCLDRLKPTKDKSSLHALLPVTFPSEENPHGLQSWYMLEGLTSGQRYETRICWVATQPTEFWLSIYPLSQVWETPELISDLATYSAQRQRNVHLPRCDPAKPSSRSSVLFLQVHAAADFYTSNKTLMSNPPDVGVDIILDPYLFNIFPASLLPIGIYIAVVSVFAYYLSGVLYSWLARVAQGPVPETNSKEYRRGKA